MDRKLRVAIAGCGGIAGAHAAAYKANSDLCELVACADVIGPAARAFGEKNACQAFADVSVMLRAVEPDVLSICTPPAGHLPVLRTAAQQKVAVLCEKPLARNSVEAREMVKLVNDNQMIFMNALCHRFHGPVNQMRDLLRAGTLGKAVHWYNRFSFRFEGVDKRWFVDPEVAGGGINQNILSGR